jgi:hypothetical protein
MAQLLVVVTYQQGCDVSLSRNYRRMLNVVGNVSVLDSASNSKDSLRIDEWVQPVKAACSLQCCFKCRYAVPVRAVSLEGTQNFHLFWEGFSLYGFDDAYLGSVEIGNVKVIIRSRFRRVRIFSRFLTI